MGILGGSDYSGGTMLEGGTLELGSTTAVGSGAVTFADSGSNANAVLQIDNGALSGSGSAHSFANTISGLSAFDVIDLSGLAYSSAAGSSSISYSNGQLVVTEGSASVSLTIAGVTSSATAADYDLYEDAHGGTYLTMNTDAPSDPSHYHP